jgi:ADP-heptose:LPS heptosyltransferase
MSFKTIIISRTDAIGDVVLTLPMAVFIKERLPDCKIVFLGRNYTNDVVTACSAVDEFVSWDNIAQNAAEEIKNLHADAIIHVFPRKELAKAAKEAGIPVRIGTSHRIFHLSTCNRRIRFSRKRSDLHEAQLNFFLLKGLGFFEIPKLDELRKFYLLNRIHPLHHELAKLLHLDRFRIILHPGSRGSAREWGIDHFAELIVLLPPDRFQIFVTGTEKEGELFRSELCTPFSHVNDLSGKLSLGELIGFIHQCDVLVAASTGPLHIAAAAGIFAVGIYPPIKPMHPGRWAPLGKNAKVFVAEKECSDCRGGLPCHCMREISAQSVAEYIAASVGRTKR